MQGIHWAEVFMNQLIERFCTSQCSGFLLTSFFFQMPIGVDPATAALFMQASQIFRTRVLVRSTSLSVRAHRFSFLGQFDLNWSGTLDIYEWKRAMFALGYYMSDFDADRLFWMIDTDRSGQISEREFCEYWAFARRTIPFRPLPSVVFLSSVLCVSYRWRRPDGPDGPSRLRCPDARLRPHGRLRRRDHHRHLLRPRPLLLNPPIYLPILGAARS